MALASGSIAFTTYSAGNSGSALSFVALAEISAGTAIHFNDNEWRGSGFNSGEAVWSWTATSDVAAGTIVTMDMLDPMAPTSNLGDITVLSSAGVSFGGSEIIYAYIGQADAPETFLSAMASRSFEGLSWDPATLAGTGLTAGVNAVALGGVDIAVYDGARLGSGNFADYLPLINDPANWVYQSSGGDLGEDGVAPDLPFSQAGFSDDPNVQVVNFAADSLVVSQAEGDSGETVLTFIVERSGDTTGTVEFTGTIDIGGMTRADDFGGTVPVSFTGTIEAGQTSGTFTVRVSGDVQFEQDEDFTLSLQAVSNDGANAVLGEDIVATGTIANDDPAPVSIAFVAYNAEGTDNLNFLVASDMAAGTVIHFNTNQWAGSSFNTGQGAWSWTAGSDIAAGTIITMDGLSSGAATSSHGLISFTSGDGADVFRDDLGETIYAYLGTPEQPTAFLTAMTTGPFGQLLAGTGLTNGVNALGLASSRYLDVAQYHGPRTGESSVEDYLAHINNPANWIIQGHFAQDTSVDGIFPDVPFQALPFSTDPTAQIAQFEAGSLTVTQNEGETGTETAFTFTVERTNGTDGDLSFTVRVPVGTYLDAANAADFVGGTLPVVTGTILDGASSTTITILVKGENLYELNERFQVMLTSASNPDASSVVIGNNSIAAATISNDDAEPMRVLAGEHHTATITLTDDAHFVIEEGGSTQGISWRGDADIVIDNGGETGSIGASGGSGGTITINNLGTGIIRGVVSAEDAGRTNYTLNNAGRIELAGDRMDLRDPADDGASVVVNNLAGGVIMQTDATQDIMRPGANTVVNNYGSILHAPGALGGSSDGLDYQGDPGVVNNYAGGLIEASRHAVTGDAPVVLLNEGTMIGRNGSAINIDSNGTEAERVFITNRGHMEGRSANLADSDGDAIDIDGLLTLENYGFIGGMGHNGYHDGEPNVSEGIAVGGGTITNHAGGEIYGYGRAIQVDNSSNANALGTTTIVNAGLIRGDGNLPTAVTPEEVAEFAERISGGEAINLLGNYGDVVTNSGQIIGGVKMGGGDDLIVNKGTMNATGGSAANLGEGNDTFEHHAGSTVTGLIDGGEGDDTLKLIGPGIGSLGANANFENLDVQSGMWTLQSDAYDQVNIAAGAMVMSQLKLADQGGMNVAQGGTVLVTNGSDAVVAEGEASIENAGLIQALGMTGTTFAKAIVTNGGEIHNKAGGIVLAQGVAISTGAAAVAGVDIVNDGMIQSLSGQAVALVGELNDSVTNKGMITGSVDLGAGDDTLAIHTGSSIAGAVNGGEGMDTVKLVGTTPATIGSFNSGSASSFEKLVVAEGVWSVADSTPYSDITAEDGATLKSPIILTSSDTLTVEFGGTVDQLAGTNTRPVTIDGPTTGVVIDNSGLMTTQDTSGVIAADFANDESNDVTIWNRESGVISMSYDNGTVIKVSGGQQTNGAPLTGVFTLNNAGQIVGGYRSIDTNSFHGEFVLNNYATGLIESDGDGTAIRGGGTFNNWGIIRQRAENLDPEEDAIDFRSWDGTVVNNYGGGRIEGGQHALTGETGVTVLNDVGGVMIGHNGSAVNIDNNGSEAEKVFITNRGTMEGRSAETSDSDGDAIDVDGLVQVLNYGRIAGLGAEGYHNGEPNVSEGIAIGGGTIVNNSTGEIYGCGRGIQVDNSSNSNALGATTVVNDGLIQGDGHGPEGVDPEDAAEFDLRGNEAINLVGDYEDWVINNSTGRIVGGISMGGGRDTLNNSGSIVATGGSAIDMGDGNDQLNLYVGSTVEGTILLGAGDDVANSTSATAYTIHGGDGNDSIAMYYTIFGGADTLYGEAGNDSIYGGLGDDFIDGGADNDTLNGESGADTILGGDGNDTIYAGIGDIIDGGAGDDVIEVSTWNGAPASIEGGEGDDTVKLAGTGTGSLGVSTGVETLLVQEGTWTVAGNASYSDITIKTGATVRNTIFVSGTDHVTIEAGATLTSSTVGSNGGAINWNDVSKNVVIDNYGLVEATGPAAPQAIRVSTTVNNGDPRYITINNHEGGVMKAAAGVLTAGTRLTNGSITVNNDGLMEATTVSNEALDFQSAVIPVVINNGATGIIRAHAGQNVIAGRSNLVVNNAGQIVNAAEISGQSAGGDAIDVSPQISAVINNLSGGLIEGNRHGITGEEEITIVNAAGAIISGRNGSGINFDTSTSDGAVQITNYGTIRGDAQRNVPDTMGNDIDGDGVDVDHTVLLHNYGRIEALGAKGYKQWFENFSEGIAAGGGEIHNHAGASIYSVDHAILIDNGSEGDAYAATTIVNGGTIEGRDGFGIKLIGLFDDSITNSGTIKGGNGTAIDMGRGDDTLNVKTGSVITGAIIGGEGNDTLNLTGTGTGTIGIVAGFENLVVQEGSWSTAVSDYSNVTIEDGATLTSTVALNNNDHLTVMNGGTLRAATAMTWSGGGNAIVDNAGLIEASSRVLNTTTGATGSLTFNNAADGVVRGTISPQQAGHGDATITINNSGVMEAGGRVMDFRSFDGNGASAVINNVAGGIIRQYGSDTDVLRPGNDGIVNNWGTITTDPSFVGGGDLIDLQSDTGGKVNNHAGGWMEGSRHAVTGDESVTVVNDGTMIGRNGSAVNIDNGGSEAEKVFITNRGIMEGRSATLSDSDGDAVDVDGLVQILNYGRIAGMGANGRHDGEPNVSEGIAIGGGTILNYGANAEIYGYGRAIQVDNSSNSNALGKTFINNEGLIKGDGHGPEGVTLSPDEVAKFDLRGNEAINLVGDYADELINGSTGRIVGGVSMGGGNDHLQSLGSFTATGGSAIDMGAGNDTVYFYTGTTVQGTVLLGAGDDLVLSTADTDLVIDAGDGNDQIYVSGYLSGDDIISGGAGEDRIYSGLGEDRIDGEADNDSLYGEAGDDLLIGGYGNDIVDGGSDDDVIFGDAGNDILIGGLGNDIIKGGADNDTFVITSTIDGRDSYDGGAGIDSLDYSALSTAVNLTLRDGVTTYATDTIENVENVIGGSSNDKLTGNSFDNVLTGNAGDDTLKGAAGDDTLIGEVGNDTLDGGADNDQLSGGLDDDTLKGAAGDDALDGGEGNDDLDGGAGNDTLLGGTGDDVLKGGGGDDVIDGSAGADTLTGGAGHDQFLLSGLSDGIDTITDFKVSGASEDQLVLSAAMFTNFTGDDAFDLIGSGFLRALSCGGETKIQIDLDGGGDDFATLALLSGSFSNGTIADHLIVQQDPIA